MPLSKRELLEIKGGTSASMINALSRIFSIVIDIGRSVGSAIKRMSTGKSCKP